MNGTWIRQMRPALTRYLDRFSDCFSKRHSRAYADLCGGSAFEPES